METLKNSFEDVIFECDNPIKFQYDLRVAIKSANRFDIDYAGLDDKFTIKFENNRVIAKMRNHYKVDMKLKEMSDAVKSQATSAVDAIDIIIQNPKAKQFIFPDLDSSERLAVFALNSGYLYFYEEGNGIKLIKRNE